MSSKDNTPSKEMCDEFGMGSTGRSIENLLNLLVGDF